MQYMESLGMHTHKSDLMTIRDISSVFTDYKVRSTVIQYTQLCGYRIAIDTSNMIHKYMNKERTKYVDGLDLLFDDPSIDHLEVQATMYVLKSAVGFMHNGITPIFVFDGKTPELKAAFAATKRSDDARKKEMKYEEAWYAVVECRRTSTQIPKDVKKAVRDNMNSRPRQTSINRVRDILIALGIPVVQANYEADHVCSRLVEDGIAVAAVTEDRDFFTHGCPRVITKYGAGKGTLMTLADVLFHLNMTFTQFRDFCIMLGTDYNDRVKGYGPVKAYDKMKKWYTLDNADIDVSCLNHHAVREEFMSRPLSMLIDPTLLPHFDIHDMNVDDAITLLTSINLQQFVEAVQVVKTSLQSVLTDGTAMSVAPEYAV